MTSVAEDGEAPARGGAGALAGAVLAVAVAAVAVPAVTGWVSNAPKPAKTQRVASEPAPQFEAQRVRAEIVEIVPLKPDAESSE